MQNKLRAEYLTVPGGYRAVVIDDSGNPVFESVLTTTDRHRVIQEGLVLSLMTDDSLLKRWDLACDGALFKPN